MTVAVVEDVTLGGGGSVVVETSVNTSVWEMAINESEVLEVTITEVSVVTSTEVSVNSVIVMVVVVLSVNDVIVVVEVVVISSSVVLKVLDEMVVLKTVEDSVNDNVEDSVVYRVSPTISVVVSYS